MKNTIIYILAVIGGISLIITPLYFANVCNNGPFNTSNNPLIASSVYTFKSPFIPENLEFANESVPYKSIDLYERIDHEFVINSFWHSSTILNLKRTGKYFNEISKYLKEEGVPDDFKYLAVAESGLTNATSPAGAKGFWQFMEGTAREYGLEVNQYVDERANLELSTRAACSFLKDAYNKTYNWTLAAASYNRGVNGILKALQVQSVDNYYDLYLNKETSRYVPRLIAIKYIYLFPEKYGFAISKDDTYQPIPVKRITVTKEIPDLVKFAKENGTNYKHLKLLNPWLLSDHLPNKLDKEYEILLPKE